MSALKQPRKTLPGVINEARYLPPKICIYGDPGIGKSTMGANSPNPIFIPTEAGIENLNIARFPTVKTLAEFLAALEQVATGDHDYQSVVIDTLNGLAILYYQAMKDIPGEKPGKLLYDFVGFGGHNGWCAVALHITNELFNLLLKCQERGMYVIILAHAGSYTDKSSRDDIVKTGASVNKNVWKAILGNMDVVGKAEYVYSVTKRKRLDGKNSSGEVVKVSTDEEIVDGVKVKQRRLIFEGGVEVDAKTRIGYELPPEMPLSWDAFAAALGNVNLLAQEVRDLWHYLDPAKAETTMKWLGVTDLADLAKANRSRLSQTRNRLLEVKAEASVEAPDVKDKTAEPPFFSGGGESYPEA